VSSEAGKSLERWCIEDNRDHVLEFIIIPLSGDTVLYLRAAPPTCVSKARLA